MKRRNILQLPFITGRARKGLNNRFYSCSFILNGKGTLFGNDKFIIDIIYRHTEIKIK